MTDLLKTRDFPEQYPPDAVRIIEAMTFSEGKSIEIIGSASLRSQQYSGDYDIMEDVVVNYSSNAEAGRYLADEFKKIIKRLQRIDNLYIGDIKCGAIQDWLVIDEHTTVKQAKTKINELLAEKIINKEEADKALSLLKPGKINKLNAIGSIKFHILRWTPKDILKGELTLRDGSKIKLEDAILTPGMAKLDVIALVQSKYTELAVVYNFYNKDKPLNVLKKDLKQSILDNIAIYKAEGNKFKVLKRRFALAKLLNDKASVKRLSNILNSELGKLYVVYSDVKTLADLLENTKLSKAEIADAIAGFKYRLSKIYSLEEYLKNEKDILHLLTTSAGKVDVLRQAEKKLYDQLQKETK